ncbi:hypothetical protein C8R42DRAFT_720495 [Lentinula raphanica]|nr:hypothetical protein C8R42DRAFT_720495 [Lentinula raphanica]
MSSTDQTMSSNNDTDVYNDSIDPTTLDNDDDTNSEGNDSNDGDRLSIDDMLFSNTDNILDSVNQVADILLARYSPLVASIKFFTDIPSTHIPNASKDFPHVIKKAPFRTDNALGVIDAEGLVPSFSVVGRLSNFGGTVGSHKVGPYFDMAPFNGEISIDNFRRGKLRTFLAPVPRIGRAPYTSDEITVVLKAYTRFQRLVGFLQLLFGIYLNQAEDRDRTLYPAGVDNNGWVRQAVDEHCLPIVSGPIFSNVPRGVSGTTSITAADLHNGMLPTPRELLRRRQDQNLAAFAVPPLPNYAELSAIRLGHMPDPEGYYKKLARNHNLSGIKINIPDFYDIQGELIHPIRYNDTLPVDTIVAVDIQPFMWDMTYAKRDTNMPVDRPARHASMHIVKMRVLPTEEADFRVLVHQYAVLKLRQMQQDELANKLAEEYRTRSIALASEKLAKEIERKQSQQQAAQQRMAQLQADLTSASASSSSKKHPLTTEADQSSGAPPHKISKSSATRKQPKRNADMSARQLEKQRQMTESDDMEQD